MMRLTDAQIHALGQLSNGTLNAFQAAMFVGRSWRRTLKRLEAEGLARFQPYANGTWRISKEGRAEVARLLSTGQLTEEK